MSLKRKWFNIFINAFIRTSLRYLVPWEMFGAEQSENSVSWWLFILSSSFPSFPGFSYDILKVKHLNNSIILIMKLFLIIKLKESIWLQVCLRIKINTASSKWVYTSSDEMNLIF